MAAQEIDHSTTFFHDPNWIAMSGGWLHANNVLFYFATSPFHDSMSANQTVFSQSAGNPQREQLFLATREKFEAELERHSGISYVVDSDPLKSQAQIKAPNGTVEMSDTWIIRKQRREQPRGEVKILDYYYIVNQRIFQAPRLDGIINYRMMNSILAIDKVINDAATLPKFSATDGHPYYGEGQRSAPVTTTEDGQHSKIGTPMPDATSALNQNHATNPQPIEQHSDERTLRAALRMTMDFGEQYYDDAPLIGEPGNFRYATTRNPVQSLKVAELGGTGRSVAPSETGTPAPAVKLQSNAPSPDPMTKLLETSEAAKPKSKRKKSMPSSELA